MGLDLYACADCGEVTCNESACRCAVCREFLCVRCLPDWRYSNDPEYRCDECDPYNERHKTCETDELLEWVVEKYMPGKSIDELKQEYLDTLPDVKPPPELPCGQCSTTDCIDMHVNEQGDAKPVVKHDNLRKKQEYGHQYTRLVGWCCKCTGQADQCDTCRGVKRAKTEVA